MNNRGNSHYIDKYRQKETQNYLDRFSTVQDSMVELKPEETNRGRELVTRLSPDRPFFVSLLTSSGGGRSGDHGTIYLYLEDLRYLKKKMQFLAEVRRTNPELSRFRKGRGRGNGCIPRTYFDTVRKYKKWEAEMRALYALFGITPPALRLGRKICQ